VTGIVSEYAENGTPRGLCRAKELYYVTTAGGPYDPTYSYGYVESLAKNFFGIPATHLVKAEMLDITGNDAEEILKQEI
jgi:FMN-dependent NADH-azoreductase